jgi:hypothetical protein
MSQIYILRSVPQTKYPRIGFRIGLGVWLLVQPLLFFEPVPFPGNTGNNCEPQQSDKNPGSDGVLVLDV